MLGMWLIAEHRAGQGAQRAQGWEGSTDRAGKGAQTELGRQLSPSWLPARAAQANRALARALTWIKSDLFPAVAGATRSFQAANKGKQTQRLLE